MFGFDVFVIVLLVLFIAVIPASQRQSSAGADGSVLTVAPEGS
jgi:hypothetical protein